MQVSQLTGVQLDHLVATADQRCEGLRFEWRDDERAGRHWIGIAPGEEGDDMVAIYGCANNFRAEWGLKRRYKNASPHGYLPSCRWELAGPIIEREMIALMPVIDDGREYWRAAHPSAPEGLDGVTPLEAAMRVFVASKYGSNVSDIVGK